MQMNFTSISKHFSLVTRLCLFAFCFVLFDVSAAAQHKFTINGYIKDSLTGETLIGANLNIPSAGKGVTTNPYGYYSITLSKGTYLVSISFVG